MHPLDGAGLKFERACEHVDSLYEQAGNFLAEENTRRVLDKFDSQARSYVRQIIDGAPTPPRWSVLLGETAHNFRSCLDHIAWQLAIAASSTGDPEDQWERTRIQFPIFCDRRKYWSKPNRKDRIWRLNGLLPRHARQVRRFQPYLRRHAPESHPLWHLNQLSNIDKHQVLHTTLIGLDPTMPPPGNFFKRIVDAETGELEYVYEFPEGLTGAHMEVVHTVGGPSEGDVYFKGDLPFQVEIEQPGTVLHEQPMLRLMDGIRTEVARSLKRLRRCSR